MTNKEDIRPIYGELQGLLSEAPKELPGAGKIFNIVSSYILAHYNDLIEKLSVVSGDNYERFIVKQDSPSIYRTKLSGLISRLHAKYFSDEPDPFGETPSTVMSQIQQQSQSFQVELLLQVQSKIDEQLHKLEPGDKKRSFLEKVKGALKSVRNTAELIALILATGKEFGLTLEELRELFE